MQGPADGRIGPWTTGLVRIKKKVAGIHGPPVSSDFFKDNVEILGPPVWSEFSKGHAGNHGPQVWSEFEKRGAGIHGPNLQS